MPNPTSYILHSNRSNIANSMGSFFDKHNISYITVYKDSEDESEVISMDEKSPSYKEKDFRRLKDIILKGLEAKTE